MATRGVQSLTMIMKSCLRLVVCSVSLALVHGYAMAEDAKAPASTQPPGVINKVGKSVVRGAEAAATGIEAGVNTAVRGIERGATAASKGIERSVKATERVVNKATNKTAGSSPSEAQK